MDVLTVIFDGLFSLLLSDSLCGVYGLQVVFGVSGLKIVEFGG